MYIHITLYIHIKLYILYIHMTKKYLLYIHAHQFAQEPKKSELVNELLNEHYRIEYALENTKLPQPVSLGEEFDQPKVMDVVVPLPQTDTVGSLVINSPEEVADRLDVKLCKHGSDQALCKFAKFDKTRRQKWCK